MTRCPCTKSICRPGTSFFYKVLSSLKQLQIHKKYANGAGLDDITKFMDKTYNLTGDVVSQVENALCAAESSRFVVRKKNLYALVCPAATLQFTPAPCVKAKLERIQQIFNSKWHENSSKDTIRRRTRRSSYSPPHFIPPVKTNDPPTATSKTNVKKSKSKAVLSKEPETSDVKDAAQSSFKSYLKSLKFGKCSSSPPSPCASQDTSKEGISNTSPKKETPCCTTSLTKSKRRHRSRSRRQKKKKRVTICSLKSSKRAAPNPGPSQTSLCEKAAHSTDESDSESSEC